MPRSRQRRSGRRAIEDSRRASVESRPLELERETAPAPRTTSTTRATGRAGRGAARLGSARATGAPSPALEKAAALERTYVMKDFRRMGVTMLVTLALLAVAGVAENALIR